MKIKALILIILCWKLENVYDMFHYVYCMCTRIVNAIYFVMTCLYITKEYIYDELGIKTFKNDFFLRKEYSYYVINKHNVHVKLMYAYIHI